MQSGCICTIMKSELYCSPLSCYCYFSKHSQNNIYIVNEFTIYISWINSHSAVFFLTMTMNIYHFIQFKTIIYTFTNIWQQLLFIYKTAVHWMPSHLNTEASRFAVYSFWQSRWTMCPFQPNCSATFFQNKPCTEY